MVHWTYVVVSPNLKVLKKASTINPAVQSTNRWSKYGHSFGRTSLKRSEGQAHHTGHTVLLSVSPHRQGAISWQTLSQFQLTPDMGSNRGGGREGKCIAPLDTEQTNQKTLDSEQTAASDWGEYCIENCMYHGHHDNKDMVRYCQCTSWVYNDCISQREEFMQGVWSFSGVG